LWRPTAVIDCPRAAALVEGRHFGPALAVVRVERMDEALEIHERCDQHLSASVFTGTVTRARRLAPLLGATVVTINDCVAPTAHPGVSIGGRGRSGLGVSRGEEGLLSMTRPVFVTESNGSVRRILLEPNAAMVGVLAKAVSWSYGGWRRPRG
jgi:aldehyde dehydrogenase (NAD+)